jgi:hypothetical protein
VGIVGVDPGNRRSDSFHSFENTMLFISYIFYCLHLVLLLVFAVGKYSAGGRSPNIEAVYETSHSWNS